MRLPNHDRYIQIGTVIRESSADPNHGLPKTEIAELTGIPKPTLYRMFEAVRTCESYGIVQTIRTRNPLEYYFDPEEFLRGQVVRDANRDRVIIVPIDQPYYPPGFKPEQSFPVGATKMEVELFELMKKHDFTEEPFNKYIDSVMSGKDDNKFRGGIAVAMDAKKPRETIAQAICLALKLSRTGKVDIP